MHYGKSVEEHSFGRFNRKYFRLVKYQLCILVQLKRALIRPKVNWKFVEMKSFIILIFFF